MLSAAIDGAREYFERKGVKLRMLALTADEPNAPARALYERVGFKKVASLGDIYIDRVNSLFYVWDMR